MKKTKTQKGITLIALIITIVVLLILAVVAINSIVNTDLIAHAENAAKTYNNSVKNEADILGGYLNRLEDATRCKHNYGDDRYCDYCGEECPHGDWNAEYNEDWEYTCNICGYLCEHEEMGYRFAGAFDYGEDNIYVCYKCEYVDPIGMTFDHNYVNSVCSNCNHTCTHDAGSQFIYNAGTCQYCGATCQHETWTEGKCAFCEKECEHENGTYTYEGNDKNSLVYAGEHAVLITCSDCNSSNYFSGTESCTFNNGECTVCGYTCDHSNMCTTGYEYTEEGCKEILTCICDVTDSYISEHWWTETGFCTNCGHQCEHKTFSNGKCTVCGLECKHYDSEGTPLFVDGICSLCKYTCTHDGWLQYLFCVDCGLSTSDDCDHKNAYLDGAVYFCPDCGDAY